MAGKELGKVLGDAISELQNASMEIEATVDMLLSIDGKIITSNEDVDEMQLGQPHITIDEFGALIGDALSELESVTMDIESARDSLQSIDGISCG